MMLLVEREQRDGGDKVPKRVLHITVKKEWFKKILAKEKDEDFREIKPFWKIRLIGKKYDYIKITNGYRKDSPSILAKYDGWRYTSEDEVTDLGTGEFFALMIGEFIETSNVSNM